ncbi:hypothetical protein KSF_107280 [Reticulibacter mediterranei]|uniref:Uncharacterized protein n=1 Tax=Reticulibacter mediterranei TaxID=2778369 RepID=A0A8J3J1P2_9CHLR|nr:hypothetical protein [Reticulibacter mediterranei]GHP00681.1 hypothetical protein KSF_107280 [Reticulibacter mediterranei]
MARQPIYDEGVIVDYYDDGFPEEHPPAPVGETEEPPREDPQAAPTDALPLASPTWTVPDLLKRTNDLFIGTTIHHDDGHPQGPLISLFARELPEGGSVQVKTFRTAELSEQAFLDHLQQAIVATMQAYFLAWADRERKRLEDEAKRRARASQAPTKVTQTTAPSTPTVTKTAQKTGVVASTPAKTASPVKEAEKKPEQKYATISMFE